MEPNPFLARLGFAASDRVVIIHTDDIGMCQASIDAYALLLKSGLTFSASAMMPCPWAPAAGAICRATPHADMGVHLTLNAEWNSFRWGPLTTRSVEAGLIDDEGYFHRTREAVQERAEIAAVSAEVEAQIMRALAMGIDVTHIDTHMGTMLHPRFFAIYFQAALRMRMPMFAPRWDEARIVESGRSPEFAAATVQALEALTAAGIAMPDDTVGMPLGTDDVSRMERAKQLLGALRPGITHFIIHPSTDTPELRAIASDWPQRVADLETFRSDALRYFLEAEGIHTIGYRALCEAMHVVPSDS